MNATALAHAWEAVPYHALLGVRVEAVDETHAVVRLPYDDANSNPGQALHGGAIASLIDLTGTLAGWASLGAPADLRRGALDLSINYVAAALAEEVRATARVLRRGKEIVYSEVTVRTPADKLIAVGLVTLRAVPRTRTADRQLAPPAPSLAAADAVRIKGAELFVLAPYMRRLGLTVERATDGTAVLTMPWADALGDADGAPHEGALAALIDTSGALASWSLTGLDMRFKASTVAIHVNALDRAPGEDVIAHARTLRRDEEIFFNQVTVASRATGTVVASGTVTYRIVVP